MSKKQFRPFGVGQGSARLAHLLFLCLFPVAFSALFAQETEVITGTPGVAKYKNTVNFRALAEFEALARTRRGPIERPPRAIPFQDLYSTNQSGDGSASPQSLMEISAISQIQNVLPVPSPAPAASFPALEDNNTAIPPDTMGAVGPNHIMTTLNTQVRIQDRQGAVLSTVDLNTFWAPIGFPDAFDPKVLYDPYQERWIFTAVADAPIFSFFSFSSILLAVSQTSDPTGNWFLYRVFADEFFNTWADYPSIGFNKDWITISVNMFTADVFPFFAGVQMLVFDKANVYTNGLGNFTRLHVPTDPFFGLVRSFTLAPAVTYDPNLAELHLMDIFEFGNNQVNSRLRLSTITGEVGREILRLGTSFTTNLVQWAPSYFGVGFFEGFAPQLGSGFLIDNNDARIQNLVYRNGSLWCTHTVFLPSAFPNHSAVQWWQLQPPSIAVTNATNAITLQFGRIEDTNAVNFYAFPSLAVNRCNDVLIGFSSFSTNQFASGSYAFRFGTDPTNAIRSPAILKAGEGPYFKTFAGFRNRWGDYSATVVDPLNDLDMWTIQEYAETPLFSTNFFDFGRWGTWWGKIDVASLAQCGQIEFARGAYTVLENGIRAEITVTNLTGMPGTVDFRTSDGTARVTEDYLESTGTLTFAPGQRSASFFVDILDDGLVNSNRTVILSLFNVTGAASLGTLTNAVLTIIDDEFVAPPNVAGEFNFSTYFDTNLPLPFMTLSFGPGYYVTDWEQAAHFCGARLIIDPERRVPGALVTITRSLPARGRVMVDFITAEGGTAVPFQDYMPTNYTLIFDDFQMSTNVLVPILSDFIPNGDKYVRLVLSNPRPAPEEETENPGVIRPTLGPGASSQIVIVEISHGDRAFFFGGFGFNSLSNYVPAMAFERFNFRVDEYPDSATEVSGGLREIPVDVVFAVPLVAGQARPTGRCIFRTEDRRIAGVRTWSPFTQAGSDFAESYANGPGGDPFSGTLIYPNPLFTDPTLTTITNYPDYEGVSVELVFTPNTPTACRQTVVLLVTNDASVEFNEDIVCKLFGIVGEQYFPHFFADQTTVTILYHDQPAGALDREWNPDNVSRVAPNEEFSRAPGANDTVYTVAVQPDGKTLLGGDFTAVNAVPRNRIARLNFNGDIDTTFNPGGGADQAVTGISLVSTNAGVQNAGKILVCGNFASFNSFLHSGITRLLPNGQVDTTFNPGKGANGPIWGIAEQSDGKIIVVGDFSQFNNVDRSRIARLHPDGALDLSFNAAPGPDFAVYSVAIVPNPGGPEKILIGGNFFAVNSQPHFRIAQLLADGSLDPAFNAGAGADGPVYSVLVQTNGLIVVGGAFVSMNDTPRIGVARLFPDGTLDPNFDPGFGANDSVYAMTLQPNGKILIGGVFTEYNRTRRMGLARLRFDGTLDTSFLDTAYNQYAGFTQPVSYAPPNFVNAIAVQPDGNVMVGGSFVNVGGNPSARHRLRNPWTVFTRADKRNRSNIARLLGGSTPGPGNAAFDADAYFADESAGTAFIQLNRTDGRLGTLLGASVTGDRIATPTLDYLNATNDTAWAETTDRNPFPSARTPWSIGDVDSVFFRIPVLDDLLQEGDELVNLTFLRAISSQNLSGEIVPLGGALGRASATLDIIDNDFPKGEFNFLLSNYVTNEFTTRAIITVIRTNGSHGSVSVQYFTRTSPITPAATACGSMPCDYEPITTPRRLDFGPGQTTNFFEVTIRDDGDVEFDENIQLVLTNATGGARLPGGTRTAVVTSTLTIVDDDFPPGRLNFSLNTFTNSEAEGFATINVTRTGGSLGTVSVQYRTLDGTATSPADYQPASGTLTWNNGDVVTKTILVPLALDGRVEGPETFRVELFNPRIGGSSNPTLLGTRTNSQVVIADGDAYGTVAFNQPYYHADENGAFASITVVRTAGSSETLSVNYSAFGESAVPGLDFTPVNGTLFFDTNQTSASFLVPLLDDSESDGNKTVRLQLLNPAPPGALLGIPDSVTLTLVDDESFTHPPGENDNTFQLTAGANGPVYSVGLYLTNGIFDGRLMIAGDFTNVNNISRQNVARLNPNATLDTTFDIGIGPNAAVRTMAIQRDGKILLGGDFTQVTGTNRNGIVRLNIEGTLDRFFNPGAGANGPVYALGLQPDEKILVGGAFSGFNDDDTRPRLVRLNTNGVVDLTFHAGSGPDGIIYALALQPDGKVLVGGQFNQFNGVVRPGLVRLHRDGRVDTTFNPGAGFNAAVRSVAVQADGKILVGGSFTTVNGVPRNFLARLDSFGNLDTGFLASGLSGANNSVHGLALQVDGKVIAVGDFTTFNDVTRNRITRLNPDGSSDPTINFGSGANSFIASVVLQPDRKIVIGGGFTLFDEQPRRRFTRLHGGSVAGPGALEFSAQPFITEENATNALVVVRRRGGTTGAVGVDFSTLDGTALAGRDYVPTNLTLSFPQGEVIRNVFLRILDNTTPHEDRQLGLALNSFTGGAGVGPRPTSSLIIVNDEALVSFSVTNYVSGEGDPSGLATISVVRTLGTNTPFTVGFTTGSGTATAFADFTPTNGTLTFNRGDLVKNFQVPILEDTLVEGTEHVGLILQNPSAKTFLGTNTATLTILDNDFAPGQILLSTSSIVVDESGGSVAVTILRTNGRTGTITFDLFTTDGTATAGLDYISTNVTIAFADGELAKTVRIPILVDFISEPSETFAITISRPTGGATLVAPTSAVVTILNNDRPNGTFVLSSASYTIVENATFLNVPVLRLNGAVSNTTVNFATAPGTATANADYVHTSGTLTFPPGVTNQIIQIPILDDLLQEGTETFALALSAPSFGAGLGTPSAAIVQIADNDSAIIVAAGATLISEASPTNGVIDPGERVTLRLGLRNIGFTNTANLVATIQNSGGVSSPTPLSANYGVLVPNGPTNFQNFTFTANVTNNGLLTVSLALTNNGQNLGTVTYQFRVGSITYNFANTTPIIINDLSTATPYPSTIFVSDVFGTITKVTATLSNINHTYPDDVDILLVSPAGDAVMLMSDAGGGFNYDAVNITIRYTDDAPFAPANNDPLISGDCLPSNYADDDQPIIDFFPLPAPTSTTPWRTNMATFNGKDPNGAWSLYIVDDTGQDAGNVAGGWSLSLTTSSPVNETPPSMQYIGMTPTGHYRLAVRGQAGVRYTLGASDDLQIYSPVVTFTMPNGGIYYYEVVPSGQCRFFRALRVP